MNHPLPELGDLLSRCHVVAVPMRTRFRGITTREVVLIDGPHGWGEFGPFLEYDDAEAAAWLAAGLEASFGQWPAPTRQQIPVNATVPAVAPDQVPAILDRFGGVNTVKVKVAETGHSLADDLARVKAVRTHLPTSALRVDANGAWSVAEAREALAALAEVGLQYAEQPCRTVAELVELKAALAADGIAVPLAADESIRRADDPIAVARTGAIDVAVVKVAPLGGVAATLAIAEQLADHNVTVVVSSALDTSVGIAAGVAAAAALPQPPWACGLGTVALFTADVCDKPLLPRHGVLPALRQAPIPEPGRFAAPPDRQAWWQARVERCWQVLVAESERSR